MATAVSGTGKAFKDNASECGFEADEDGTLLPWARGTTQVFQQGPHPV